MKRALTIPKRVLSQAMDDNITGEAAKATYYLFFSIFPMMIAAIAFAGLLGGENAFAWLMERVETLAPGEGGEALLGFAENTLQQRRPDLLSFGLLLALWAGSNFFAALGQGLDRMWGVDKEVSFLRRRGKALLMLFAGGLLLLGGATVILLGPVLADPFGIRTLVEMLRWPIGFIMIAALMWLMYYILPARDQSDVKVELLWGAIVGTAVWMIATMGFSFYTSNIGDYDATYGAFGTVIVLMLWLFITAVSVLLGSEVADVLEQRREGREGRENRVQRQGS
jgi:membrane protein